MGFQGLIGYGGGATGVANVTASAGDGLIFDFDPGRMSGYSDSEQLGDGFNFTSQGAISYTGTTANGVSSQISCTISGGSCHFKTANGGHLDTNTNNCRILIGNGGSPTTMGGDGGLLDTTDQSLVGWF